MPVPSRTRRTGDHLAIKESDQIALEVPVGSVEASLYKQR